MYRNLYAVQCERGVMIQPACFYRYREAREYIRNVHPSALSYPEAAWDYISIIRIPIQTTFIDHLCFPLHGKEYTEFMEKHKHRIDLSFKRRYIL
jgi:hypothetical protein